jgi:pimeloyl-ACP methyl ester carboxylesterase
MYFLSANLLRRAPRGDGHHVLVLPGLGGGDATTRAMRAFLRRLDYYVHAWRLGTNWGPTDRIIDGLGERFRVLFSEHGRRLSLIGHSMGGIYARELARRAPQAVRQVITLGSPVRWGPDSTSNAEPLYRTLSRVHSDRAKGAPRREVAHVTPGVPLTAVFTYTDGIVHWSSCVVNPSSQQESIEVRGSHSGLIHNPVALLVVADRLGQMEGKWTPFEERAGIDARVWTDAAD